MSILQKVDNPALWLAPPQNLALCYDEVHVWRFCLDMRPSQIVTLSQMLSSDELIKARRFYFQRDRDHFIAARGLLRTILGRYVGRDPNDLRFCYGPNGKPALTGETGEKFRFNISHSHDLCIFAVVLNRDIGVDLEYIRADPSAGDITEQFLSPSELRAFKALPDQDRPRAFFSWWTRKEAYLKAKGLGLAGDLKQFEVIPPAAEFPGMSSSGQEEALWLLMDLAIAPGYAAALAVVDGHGLQLEFLQWESAYCI
jgi:4'-phosphopantetheinyl transferase